MNDFNEATYGRIILNALSNLPCLFFSNAFSFLINTKDVEKFDILLFLGDFLSEEALDFGWQ